MAVYEVALAVADREGVGRAKEGDIIAVRKPLEYVGRIEEGNLWVGGSREV
jgi:hypothetical protein